MDRPKDFIIFIDNFDSFSYNLVNALQTLGLEVLIYRNDVDVDFLFERIGQYKKMGMNVKIVLSPGPSTPQKSGNLMEIVKRAMGTYPILGICLGHQALGLALGGQIAKCRELYHGKVSLISHKGDLCFEGLPNPVRCARYHSLYVEGLDPKYVVASWEEICMALYSKERRVMGLQFHVESIMTTYGMQILKNALNCI